MPISRLIIPSVCIIIGVIYLILTLNLPKARLGDPDAPMYFPLLVAIFFIVISIVYFIKELLNHYNNSADLRLLLKGRTPYLIISTIVLSLIYSLIFERIGFLISTILFLGALLFVVNGANKWKTNILVAVLFSGGSWFIFSKLLEVSLP